MSYHVYGTGFRLDKSPDKLEHRYLRLMDSPNLQAIRNAVGDLRGALKSRFSSIPIFKYVSCFLENDVHYQSGRSVAQYFTRGMVMTATRGVGRDTHGKGQDLSNSSLMSIDGAKGCNAASSGACLYMCVRGRGDGLRFCEQHYTYRTACMLSDPMCRQLL